MPIQAVITLYSCGHPVEVRIIQVAYLSAELLQNRPFSTLDEIGRCFKLNWPFDTGKRDALQASRFDKYAQCCLDSVA
jgi:hypothetical protein